MKLDLHSLFALFEELEATGLIQERPEQSAQRKSIPFPRLFISENWGKDENPDREDLKMALQNAGVTIDGDPITTLRGFRTGLETTIANLKKDVETKNPAQILSQLVIFDTLNRLFNSFQSSPLGFVNEAFLSVLYGGQQIPAQEGNESGQIGDVVVRGIPVSIKTIGETTDIGGSVQNLVDTLNEYDKVYFDIFVKKTDGKEINGFKAYRFVVTKENAHKLIQGMPNLSQQNSQQSLGESLLSESRIEVSDTGNIKEFIQDLRNINWSEQGIPSILEKWSINNIWIDEDLVSDLFLNINPKLYGKQIEDETGEKKWVPVQIRLAGTAKKWQAIKDYSIARGLVDSSEKNKFIEIVTKLESSADTRKSTTGKIAKSQFKITQDAAIRMAGGTIVDLDFSRSDVDDLISLARQKLQNSVFDLFNQLESFSENISKYFMSTAPDRVSNFGKPAIDAANQIKTKSEQAVKEE